VTDTRHPGAAAAYLTEARACYERKDIGEMTEVLKLLGTSPDCSAADHLEAAKLFAAAGATADAARAYREAGNAFIDPEADTVRARQAFDAAHALVPTDLDIIFEIGRVEVLDGEIQHALAHFVHVLRNSRYTHTPALFEAACIYENLGLHDQAVLTFRKVLDRDKTNVQAIVSMAQRLQKMGMIPEAVGYFMQAADAAHAAGRLGTCRHVLSTVLALAANNHQARTRLAEMDELLAAAHDEMEVTASAHAASPTRAESGGPPVSRASVGAASALATPPQAPDAAVLQIEIDELAARDDLMQRRLAAVADALALLEATVVRLTADMSDLKQKERGVPPARSDRKSTAPAAATKASTATPNATEIKPKVAKRKAATPAKSRKAASAKGPSPRR
jgi:hypothetical protein